MRSTLKGAALAVVILAVLVLLATIVFLKTTGLSARAEPGPVETAVARRLRALAVPGEYTSLRNPVLVNEESLRNGMAHFADHCAQCHANDGAGSEMGKTMFPPTPDLKASATQSLGDGELFYIIEHGVRFTGMPAFGTGTVEGEESSWHLVNFIRHMPTLTDEELAEMAAMNPRPPAEVLQELEEQRFLAGEEPSPPEAPAPHAH